VTGHAFPPPDNRRERIVTHEERGWIATGVCGRPHLIGRGWSWWRCPNCAALADQPTPHQLQETA